MPSKIKSKITHSTSSGQENQRSKTTKKTTLKKITAEKTAAVKRKETKKIIEVAGAIRQSQAAKSFTIDTYNVEGRKQGSLTLPREIFGAKINDKLMAQAVRVYLANQRGGFASTKTRGEVHGSTRKIFRQKGTGRARHGSKKAPIFIHGGIAHGPHPRDFSLTLSKKMKKLALFSALSLRLSEEKIKGLTGFEKIQPKTKVASEALLRIGVSDKNRNVLIVTPKKSDELENFYRAVRNIEGVRALPVNTINTYEVLHSRMILLMKSGVDLFRETFLKERKD